MELIKQKDKALPLIIISGICTGSIYPLIKIAENHDIPKFAYIFWESLLVTLLLIGIAIYQKEKTLFNKNESPYYLFCALTNIVIPQSLFFIIAPNLPATIISLIIILTPIFVYLKLLACKDEIFILKKGLGVTTGLIGATLLFLPAILSENKEISWLWLLFAFLLPINYSINRIFATSLKPKNSPPYRLAIGLFSLVSVISGFAMIISNQIILPFASFNAGWLALIAHAIIMVIFYIIFFILADKSALKNALGFYVTPLTGIFWGIVFFGEDINAIFLTSTFLIFIGLYLANAENKKP